MSQSLSLIQHASHIEDMEHTSFSPRENLSYYVEQDPGHTWHHERLLGIDGTEIYDQRMAVDVAVGSGASGRSYLINSFGRLYASPITWYAQDAHWGLSPGYPAEHHERFDRRVTHSCLSCHAGRANPHATDTNRFAEPLFAEESIGCERCHGPGESHVKYQRTGESLRTGIDPIINPEKLSSARRDAVCNQCHLQGNRRVLKDGMTEFDFRPGMHLSEMWTIFLKTAGVKSGKANAVSQVEQMYSSTCYLKSDGGLTCISCHDPHQVPSGAAAVSQYRDRCLKCHSIGQKSCSEPLDVRHQRTSDDSCIVCHMPKFGAADVHSAQTDHRILRRQPLDSAEPSELPKQSPGPVIIFEEPGAGLTQLEKDRATGIFLAETGYENNDLAACQKAARLLDRVYQKNPRDIESAFSLGKSLVPLGRSSEAAQILLHVLEVQPRHEEALDVLASACHETGKLRLARQYYERLLEVNPTRARYFGRYAHVAGQLGDFNAGIQAAEKSLEMDPSLVQAHEWLAEAYKRLGNAEKSQFHKNKIRFFGTAQPSGKK
jgi:predicted CXXCH cytochrome family protein